MKKVLFSIPVLGVALLFFPIGIPLLWASGRGTWSTRIFWSVFSLVILHGQLVRLGFVGDSNTIGILFVLTSFFYPVAWKLESTLRAGEKKAAAFRDISGEGFVLPERPKMFDKVVTVQSESEDKRYKVNLYKMTCSCPDFEKRRGEYPLHDARRMCKHIAQKMEDALPSLNFPQPALGVVKNASEFGTPPHSYKTVQTPDGDALVAFRFGKEWQNVFTPWQLPPSARFDNYSYGFNPFENRWARDEMPPHAALFEDLIRQYATAVAEQQSS